MRIATLGLAAALATAGCGENSAPSCDKAVAHLQELAAAQGGEVPAERTAQLVAMCEDQRWSAARRRCLGAAETPEAAQACLKEEL